jgi:NAD(P)-dependent dehydrogenase (short-subunit alcohol dehydrogenase family)
VTSEIRLDLTGKVAFISGGASGIGSVIARTLIAQGAKVFVSDIDDNALSGFLSSCKGAEGLKADAGSWPDTQKVFTEIQSKFGRLDILVNNAGIAGPTAAVEEIDPDDWNRTIAVDINGVFYAMKLATPMIKAAGGGSVINIASNAAFFGFPLRSPYTASKWALIGLTKTWAMELGCDGIRVNALCPGSVSGPRIDGVIERDAALRGVDADKIREIYTRQSSLQQFVEPEDVASMVAFLCSDAGTKISGQAIGIDGHTEGLGAAFD